MAVCAHFANGPLDGYVREICDDELVGLMRLPPSRVFARILENGTVSTHLYAFDGQSDGRTSYRYQGEATSVDE